MASRKACHLCAGVRNPSTHPLDCDEIGPWSQWQGNLEAPIMVVGQDWGDWDSFATQGPAEDDRNPTNRMLRELLASIGHPVCAPSDRHSPKALFFTNAILCMKDGKGLQAGVRPEWFDNCGRTFLRPTIDLVRPRVVATLGANALRAVLGAYGLPRIDLRAAASRQDPILLREGVALFAMYHCGARVLNTCRKRDQQFEDWERVRVFLSVT